MLVHSLAGGDLVGMGYNCNGNAGSLLGTSEAISINSNQVPCLNVRLNTINLPRPISFRYVVISVNRISILIQNTTSPSFLNVPIATPVHSSILVNQGYVFGNVFGIELGVGATQCNSFPSKLNQFRIYLDCLDPS